MGPGPGAGGKHWGHDRQAPDCVLYGSSAQGGAARKLRKEAATATPPDEKTKGILENFTRQRDLGQATTSAGLKSTAAKVHAKTSGTRKTVAARPRKPQHTTPKSRATPTKHRPNTAKRKAPSPSSSSSSSSSTTPADTKKTKGTREDGMQVCVIYCFERGAGRGATPTSTRQAPLIRYVYGEAWWCTATTHVPT